jgi:phosphatidate cytidylyltransferase
MTRVITATALAVFALYTIFWAPLWAFTLVVAAMAILCYHEYRGIARSSGVEGALWLGYAGGLIAMARPDTLPLLALAAMVFALISRDLRKALGFAGTLILGIVYIFIAWRWAIDLRMASPFWVLFALSINWVGDIAAYYVGRSFGKHKLAPRISPAKSWEGAVASLVMAVLFGVGYNIQFTLGLSQWDMVFLSIVANIAGQLGDLSESAMKRGAGLKDSGTLLPGHGGFLDRLDSSLFTLPVVYYYLSYASTVIP